MLCLARAATWGKRWRVGRGDRCDIQRVAVLVYSGRSRWREWADRLEEGKERDAFDIRREGARDSEDEEHLEALAGGGRHCHMGVVDTYTEMGWDGQTDGHTCDGPEFR